MKGKNELFTELSEAHDSSIYTDTITRSPASLSGQEQQNVIFRANLKENNKLHLPKSNIINIRSTWTVK